MCGSEYAAKSPYFSDSLGREAGISVRPVIDIDYDIEIDAIRLINEDIQNILGDLQISTELKFKIDAILFSDLSIAKKRIEIRKLKNSGLERKYVLLFINLLEYIEEV